MRRLEDRAAPGRPAGIRRLACRVAAAAQVSCRQVTDLNERDVRPQLQAPRKFADGHTIRHEQSNKRGFRAVPEGIRGWTGIFSPCREVSTR